MKKVKVILLSGTATLLIAVGGVALYRHLHASPIPPGINKQIDFTVLLPSKRAGVLDKKSVKYNPDDKVLTFKSQYAGAQLIISEQAMPPQFVDVPQAYDKFTEQLPSISDFETDTGKVSIAPLKGSNGITFAVLNGKGDLIFVKPNKPISDRDWRIFFNSLEVVK